jgi:hypothetical protein
MSRAKTCKVISYVTESPANMMQTNEQDGLYLTNVPKFGCRLLLVFGARYHIPEISLQLQRYHIPVKTRFNNLYTTLSHFFSLLF